MEKLKTAWEKFKRTKFCGTLKEYTGLDDLIAIIITAIGTLYYCQNGFLPYHAGWHAFYERIHVELIGIGITVLILGNANQCIQIKQEKRSLILQMGSPDNAFAIEAVRLLQIRDWLYDGTTKGIYLVKANLKNADLGEAHLEYSNLRLAHLEHSNLSGAYLNRSDLSHANLEEALLLQANLKEVRFYQAHLKNANFSWADLNRAHLENTDMIRAILKGANLEQADLSNANLENANLCWTNLRKITFNKSTIWNNVKFNKHTHWPQEFDPQAAGCVLVEDE